MKKIRSLETFLFVFNQLNGFFESFFKDFVNVLSGGCRSWKILVASFFCKRYGFSRFDLFGF